MNTMENKEKFKQQIEEIIEGLSISTEEMVEFKKSKNSPIVVSKDGEIVHVNPHDFQIINDKKI